MITTPQSKHQNQSLINVFSENSRINEEKIPLQVYNGLLQEEIPANKIYDKKDPFLINLNLRKKLYETN